MSAAHAQTDILLRATARARNLRGRILVVKLGGSAMEEPTATRGTLESVVALQTLGVKLVLVHGGGKPIDRAMAAAGLIPRKVAGRRYTDEATLQVVVQVLSEINNGLVLQLQELGGETAGFGRSHWTRSPGAGDIIQGSLLQLAGPEGQPIDLGRVGVPQAVNMAWLEELLKLGKTPIIPSLARDHDGAWLNVNADTAAAAVAGTLKAEACLFLTDTPGVLRDIKDPGSLFPRLTRSECKQLMDQGIIAGGMIPKVEACFEALDAGAGRAVILDGRDPYALLGEFVSANPTGTVIIPN